MHWDAHFLAPFPVLVPFAAAVVLAALSSHLPRWFADLTALLASAANVALCGAMALQTKAGPVIYWFGGWQPDAHHFPIGIGFLIDPVAAGAAGFVGALVFLALVFSCRSFNAVKTLYHVLMLVFLGAMSGLCLSGDLFNLFVWFELMTAAAIALCGYKCQETGPLQGALNFAVPNTVGAFLTLTGIAFLYGLTGSLNFAGISEALRAHPPATVFIVAAFLFTCTGFLVKAAAFPFHFWLADAHAVAPTPVCMLFSGVMVELGVYALARLWCGVFLPAMAPYAEAVRHLLVAIGTASALLGALECSIQHHLKRLLAFSTLSHTGLMLAALGLATPASLAGFFIYGFGHGGLKAAVFAGAGIVLHRYGSLDEHQLHGAARRDWLVGVLLLLAALGLLAIPPFGTFYGDGYFEAARDQVHGDWQTWIAVIASGLTAAAVIRFILRAFFAVGTRASPPTDTPAREDRETGVSSEVLPANLWLPVLAGLGLAVAPALAAAARQRTLTAMTHWLGSNLFANAVLTGSGSGVPAAFLSVPQKFWPGLAATGLAAVVLVFVLSPMTTKGARAVFGLWCPFHNFQSGRVGDYVAWLAAGLAAMGAALTLMTR